MTISESQAQESGDENANGSDEELPVGHQRHAHNAQMTRSFFYIMSAFKLLSVERQRFTHQSYSLYLSNIRDNRL